MSSPPSTVISMMSSSGRRLSSRHSDKALTSSSTGEKKALSGNSESDVVTTKVSAAAARRTEKEKNKQIVPPQSKGKEGATDDSGDTEEIDPQTVKSIPDVEEEWSSSVTDERRLVKLTANGILPEKALIGWRSNVGMNFPTPATNEVVLFEMFFQAGLGLPICDFLQGILYFYLIELYNLNPNSILQIAIFVHLCEAFLGIEPHYDLFRHVFHLKTQKRKNKLRLVGGCGFQARIGAKSCYLTTLLKSSQGSWSTEWFYLADPESSLAPFSHPGKWPIYNPSWENAELLSLQNLIADLRQAGPDAIEVARDFLARRVQPLKMRTGSAWEYSGPSDGNWEKNEEPSEKEVNARLHKLFSGNQFPVTPHP